ncbi:hypothetical protein PIB30_059250 [Stylosanthes scabra]|uniref:Uncharacterized protein n=1 Tax=Stylosanthes scabra TaxID=79078 RepID=A0ABU6WJU7_9FABA|nr:hypothetical protein [Stylosanthes scabra]
MSTAEHEEIHLPSRNPQFSKDNIGRSAVGGAGSNTPVDEGTSSSSATLWQASATTTLGEAPTLVTVADVSGWRRWEYTPQNEAASKGAITPGIIRRRTSLLPLTGRVADAG